VEHCMLVGAARSKSHCPSHEVACQSYIRPASWPRVSRFPTSSSTRPITPGVGKERGSGTLHASRSCTQQEPLPQP
jgi:hypothetical protein